MTRVTLITAALVLAASFSGARAVRGEEGAVPAAMTLPAFAEQTPVDVAGCWPGGMIAADLTGDGKTDLVFTDQHYHKHERGWFYGHVVVMKGDGRGGFTEAQRLQVGTAPKGLAAADLDGDGDLDVAVAEFYSETLTVLHNDGSGRLAPSFTYDTVPADRKGANMLGGATKYNPIAVGAGDFNRDGKMDLVVLNNTDARSTASNVAIFINWDRGMFYQVPTMHDPTNYFLSSVQVADVNGDGLWDLVIGNYGDNGQLSVNIGKGDGTFQKGVLYVGDDMGFRQNKPMFVQVADFDRDGALDVAAAGEKGGVFLFRQQPQDGKATGRFTRAVKTDTGAGQGNCVAMAQADFNGDGFIDLAVTHQTPESLSILSGRGDGTFDANFMRTVRAGFVGQSIAGGDFNGDGRPDLALIDVNLRDPDNPVARLTVLLGKGVDAAAGSGPAAAQKAEVDRALERQLEIRVKEMELTPDQKEKLRGVMLSEKRVMARLAEKHRAASGDEYARTEAYRKDEAEVRARIDAKLREFLRPEQVIKYRAPFTPVPGLGNVNASPEMLAQVRRVAQFLNPGRLRRQIEATEPTDEQKPKIEALLADLDKKRGPAIQKLFAGGDGADAQREIAGLRDGFESDLKQILSTEQFEKYLAAASTARTGGGAPEDAPGAAPASGGEAAAPEKKPEAPAAKKEAPAGEKPAPATKEGAPAEKWTCSMHPQVLADKPGRCPICGMRLVPAKSPAPKPAGGAAAPEKKPEAPAAKKEAPAGPRSLVKTLLLDSPEAMGKLALNDAQKKQIAWLAGNVAEREGEVKAKDSAERARGRATIEVEARNLLRERVLNGEQYANWEELMRGAIDTFYEMSSETLEGEAAGLSRYQGKVTLVVNVASKCGFTPQYAGLEKLHREYEAKGFSVLGFPSNDFGGQEPGTAKEIREFCSSTYEVSFPMFHKVVTKSGKAQSPEYAFLTRGGKAPMWNFCKYLIGKDGKVIAFYDMKVTPESKELRAAIDKALAG